jgi:hypothetical protein
MRFLPGAGMGGPAVTLRAAVTLATAAAGLGLGGGGGSASTYTPGRNTLGPAGVARGGGIVREKGGSQKEWWFDA